MKTKQVYSSHVHSIGYDPDKQELSVTWQKDGGMGKTSIYQGVPHHVAHQVYNAASVGDALHSMVKGQYGHRYV